MTQNPVAYPCYNRTMGTDRRSWCNYENRYGNSSWDLLLFDFAPSNSESRQEWGLLCYQNDYNKTWKAMPYKSLLLTNKLTLEIIGKDVVMLPVDVQQSALNNCSILCKETIRCGEDRPWGARWGEQKRRKMWQETWPICTFSHSQIGFRKPRQRRRWLRYKRWQVTRPELQTTTAMRTSSSSSFS